VALRRLGLLTCAAFILCTACAFAAPDIVIVVRHAEKAALPADDPPLNAQGKQRAAELARLAEAWTAAGTPIRALFASEVQRTQQTLAPTVALTHLPVTITPANDIEALVKKIRAVNGGVAVVVGHSNTVPAIVKALGGAPDLTIGDAEYDRVFVITPVGVIEMRYGARTDPAR
jgi:phosphohistidine phosphatase SixA